MFTFLQRESYLRLGHWLSAKCLQQGSSIAFYADLIESYLDSRNVNGANDDGQVLRTQPLLSGLILVEKWCTEADIEFGAELVKLFILVDLSEEKFEGLLMPIGVI